MAINSENVNTLLEFNFRALPLPNLHLVLSRLSNIIVLNFNLPLSVVNLLHINFPCHSLLAKFFLQWLNSQVQCKDHNVNCLENISFLEKISFYIAKLDLIAFLLLHNNKYNLLGIQICCHKCRKSKNQTGDMKSGFWLWICLLLLGWPGNSPKLQLS